METKIILNHGDQVFEFLLQGAREIALGRDTACDVRFDAEEQDLVSRKHSVLRAKGAAEFWIEDAGSRNGTFVNRQRVSSPQRIEAGDVIQLGPGGPELRFDYTPKPVAARPTRLVEVAAARPTRAVDTPAPVYASKATVERLVSVAQRRGLNWAAAMAVVAAVLAVGLGIRNVRAVMPNKTKTPAAIAAANRDSVVFFEAAWKLVDMESGRPLFHVYQPNLKKNEAGEEEPILRGAPAYLPVFVAAGNQLEPMLSTDEGGGKYRAIGGRHTGSGFAVSADGFILTNRHVAASWQTRYNWSPGDPAGMVVTFDEQMQVKQRMVVPASNFPAWVPANARFLIQGNPSPDSIRIVPRTPSGKFVEGRNDYLEVTFAKARLRNQAKVVRISDRSDVAMVKVDLPAAVRPVEILDNYESVKAGDGAIVMGYPGVSPAAVAVTQSQDMFNSEAQAKVIPDPTVSTGNVGLVHRGQPGAGTEGLFSMVGDLYQLTINSTGAGNSGGPVFDEQGRVVAIFNAGASQGGASISFAVPIRYGLELMGGAGK